MSVRRKEDAPIKRSAKPWAVLLLGATIGCLDQSVRPEPAPAPTLAPLVLQPNGLSCTEPDARLSSGALFEVCFNPDRWNRDLVVFIPGHVDPARAPTLPHGFAADTAVSVLFTKLGYGFATTSFRGTGLIEPATWIGTDLLELVSTAKTLLSSSTGRTPRYIYQTGGSQGGLGTVMAVERYPGTFSGGLAVCGPIGDYKKQIDYVGDFRAVFDYYFAGVIPEWPVWTQDLGANNPGSVDPTSWGAAEQASGAALDDPGNAARIEQVLSVTHAPVDASNPASIKATAQGILWYSFRGTNDGILKLGGLPFTNVGRVYGGSLDDAALNADVARFQLTADQALVAALQTSSHLRRPLVTIHTTGDPIVPIWHETLYRRRLDLLGRLLETPITVSRYGHCTFTSAELLGAFAVLVLKVTGYNLLVPRDVLARPQEQAQFLRIAREHGASPTVAPTP